MIERSYLTREDGERFIIPYDYKQTFHHEMRFMQTPREYDLVKNFYNMDEELQAIELEILKFLRDFCFGTESQFLTLLGAKGLNPDLAEFVLDACVRDRVLNYFTLSQYVLDEIPDDAFPIYCLDHGARHVLTHFSQRDYLSWLSSDNIRSSELISKYLMTGMFYLQVIAVKGDKLRAFNPLADFSIGRRDIRFSSTFQIMEGFNARDFIFEVVRSDDLPTLWQEKVNEKIAPFILKDYWKMYYETMPVLIILTQTDQDALEAGEIFYRRIGNNNFRLLTDKNMVDGLNVAPFYAYIPKSEEQAKSSLKKVKARIFCEN